MLERLSPGTTVSHFRVLSRIGAGGMGEVYLAEDTQLPRRAALKVLSPEHVSDPDRLRRFEHEAHAASALSHPNILVVYEVGCEGALHYIATEFVEGETLRKRLLRGPLATLEALDVAIQVAAALASAHAAGIVHRDIKPENLMLRPDGFVKVLDFGLAKLSEAKVDADAETAIEQLKTNPGTVLGSISYMSPEQARGLQLDARSDIFSLGVVLYEMLSGRSPFKGTTPTDVLIAVVEKPAPPLAGFVPGVPGELERIVSKALAKDRENRYQSAKDLQIDLRSLKQGIEAQEVLRRSGPSTAPPVRRRAPRVAALLAVLVLAAAPFVYRWIQGRGETPSQVAAGAGIAKITQITTWSGLDIHPSLSPDGNSVVYSSDRGGSFELYMKPLAAGGRELQLTSDKGQNFEPALSPDGRYIAYHSKRRGGIWVMPALGGASRQIAEFGSNPKWSPDGTQIAFQSEAIVDLGVNAFPAMPPSTLWRVSVQGGPPVEVTRRNAPPGGHGAPAWSPDGRRIVFVASDVTVAALWTVSVDGGELERLVGRQRCFDPIWSPDGNVYYPGSGPANWHLWRLPVSTSTGKAAGDPTSLRDTGGTLYRHLALSRDGGKLVTSGMSMVNDLWSLPLSPRTSEPAGPPRPLTRDTSYRKSNAIFSPDGDKIAYGLTRVGSPQEIWAMDRDGGNPVQIMSDTVSTYVVGWLSSREILALLSQQAHLLAFDVGSNRRRTLRKLDFDLSVPRISPDGKEMVFNSKASGTINLWTAPTTGDVPPRQLTFDRELMGFACWSPDGRDLAFEMKRGEDTHIVVMPRGGGAVSQLTAEPGQSWPYTWSPDGDKVAFAAMREGIWNIAWVSKSTKQQKLITKDASLNTYVRYPAWSPRGDQIVYERAAGIGNIWLLELR